MMNYSQCQVPTAPLCALTCLTHGVGAVDLNYSLHLKVARGWPGRGLDGAVRRGVSFHGQDVDVGGRAPWGVSSDRE
jgi:hypothetical protein